MKRLGFAVVTAVLFIAQANQLFAANFTGDGGRGIRIIVRGLDEVGLPAEQSYLPVLIQGDLMDNFRGFSDIDVRCRESMEAILVEHEEGGQQTTEDFLRLHAEILDVDYQLTGRIIRTATGHALQLEVEGMREGNIGRIRASFSGTLTVAEMDDLSGIRRASMDLLLQMGVNLTASARQELAGAAAANRISGGIALSRGIIAQRQGRPVIATLSYYIQATQFDPTLLEAVSRASILHASISSGNIGYDVLNEIELRRNWVELLTETEQFFADFHQRASMPYTLFYTFYTSDDITQGPINFQTETVNLSIETHLHGSGIWTVSTERALQAVHDGLVATGRAQAWGLGNWPRQGVTNLNAFARHSNNFSVVFELLNDQNRVIGRQTLQTGGFWELSMAARPSVNVSASNRQTLNFQNVNANDISDRMSIRVASVNGIAAETAARDRVLQIRAVSRGDFARYDRFRFARGEVQGFSNHAVSVANLTIPSTIWGDPVISIGARAFNRTGLTSVVIPSSVAYIGGEAFLNNDLTRITIGANVTISANSFGGGGFYRFPENYNQNGRLPGIYNASMFRFVNGEIQGLASNVPRDDMLNHLGRLVIPVTIWGNYVTSIGAGAFRNARLRRVDIPSGVTHIRADAFRGNDLRGTITIPNGVTYIGRGAFRDNLPMGITIPSNVSIESEAFHVEINSPTEITVSIGANVEMAGDAFVVSRRSPDGRRVADNSFSQAYSRNGAGTYIWRGTRWRHQRSR